MPASIAPPLDGGGISNTPSPYTPPSPITLVKVVLLSLAHAIIIAILYLLCNLLAKCFRRTSSGGPPSNQNSNQTRSHVASNGLLESLPILTFSSVGGTLNGSENCAVCLSEFEPPDELRVLPLCCHAFHAKCIDAWIVAKQTCPLCRSTVLSSDPDVHDKFLPGENSYSGSFQIEIGIS